MYLDGCSKASKTWMLYILNQISNATSNIFLNNSKQTKKAGLYRVLTKAVI